MKRSSKLNMFLSKNLNFPPEHQEIALSGPFRKGGPHENKSIENSTFQIVKKAPMLYPNKIGDSDFTSNSLVPTKKLQTTEASVYLGQVGESRVAHCDLADAITAVCNLNGIHLRQPFWKLSQNQISWMSLDVIVLISPLASS